MQMYDIVATGVLGLLVGFWSGRSIRWKMDVSFRINQG